MGCGCGGGGSALGNWEVKDQSGTVVKTLNATTETEAKIFAQKVNGTYRKTS